MKKLNGRSSCVKPLHTVSYTWPELLEAWLALTSVNYDRNVSLLLNHSSSNWPLEIKIT